MSERRLKQSKIVQELHMLLGLKVQVLDLLNFLWVDQNLI